MSGHSRSGPHSPPVGDFGRCRSLPLVYGEIGTADQAEALPFPSRTRTPDIKSLHTIELARGPDLENAFLDTSNHSLYKTYPSRLRAFSFLDPAGPGPFRR